MKSKTDHVERTHDPWHEFLECEVCAAIIETKLNKLETEDTLREVKVADRCVNIHW